jgi:hypothetical protein
MAKKNYTWKLEEELVSKIQQLAEKEHRSLTNYIEVMFIEKSKSVAVGGKKIKKKMRHNARRIYAGTTERALNYCRLSRPCINTNVGRRWVREK